jgi:hypothetical protein
MRLDFNGPSWGFGALCATVYWGMLSPWWLLLAPLCLVITPWTHVRVHWPPKSELAQQSARLALAEKALADIAVNTLPLSTAHTVASEALATIRKEQS